MHTRRRRSLKRLLWTPQRPLASAAARIRWLAKHFRIQLFEDQLRDGDFMLGISAAP